MRHLPSVATFFRVGREPLLPPGVYLLKQTKEVDFFVKGNYVSKTSWNPNYCIARECAGNSLETAICPSHSLRW
jgi:hypothetical protein